MKVANYDGNIGRIGCCIAACFRGTRMCRWPTFLTTRWISQHGLAETRNGVIAQWFYFSLSRLEAWQHYIKAFICQEPSI